MRVTSLEREVMLGRRGEMQDVALARTVDDAVYMGVFDGHGFEGARVAQTASRVILDLAATDFTAENSAIDRAVRSRAMLIDINENLRAENPQLPSGSTAVLAIIKDGLVTVTSVGDSDAVYIPDSNPHAIRRLGTIHNYRNQSEVERVKSLNIGVVGDQFANTRALSRSLGDFDLSFIIGEAEISSFNIPEPGRIVVASDGIDYDRVEDIANLARAHPNSGFAKGLVDHFTKLIPDNASVIVAKIE